MTSKRFTFTINNPKGVDHEILSDLKCRYICYASEVAPTTGTQHLQGYVVFETNKTLVGTKKVLPFGAHIEVAKGSTQDNIRYCSKENTPYERGVAPQSNTKIAELSKDKWSAIVHNAKEGNFDAIPEDVLFRYYNTAKSLARDHQKAPPPLETCCGLWIYGEPGTGKSHAVQMQHPGSFMKPLNKWWDGYQKQELVHLDEIEPSHATWIAPYLKKWADKWPFPAETKGSSMTIRPKRIVVTSNYSIDEMGFDVITTAALKRRYEEIQKTRDQNIIV